MDVLGSQAELPHDGFDKLQHGFLLCGGAGVGWCGRVIVQSANVTNANAGLVVTLAMGALLGHLPATHDIALLVNDIMIADISPAIFGYVPPPNLFHSNNLRCECGSAVQDNFIYRSVMFWCFHC